MKKQNKRNGEIELLRFVFCVIILLMHSKHFIPKPYPFLGGGLSVEFFFLVSGYLMARTVERMNSNGSDSLGTETVFFIRKKISALMPEYVISWIIAYMIVLIAQRPDRYHAVDLLLTSGWELVFLKMAGLGSGSINGAVWYISSMLLCMAIMYPLMRKHRDIMLHIVLPLTSTLILGWLYKEFGNLRTPEKWCFIVYKGNLRAFAELGLGVILYHLVNNLSKVQLTTFGKWCVSLAKWAGLVIFCYYMWWKVASVWDFGFLLLLMFCVGVVFSELGIDAGWYNTSLCFWLGKYSLSLYLCHFFFSYNIQALLPRNTSTKAIMLAYLICSFVTAFVVMLISDYHRKKRKNITTFLKHIFIQ